MFAVRIRAVAGQGRAGCGAAGFAVFPACLRAFFRPLYGAPFCRLGAPPAASGSRSAVRDVCLPLSGISFAVVRDVFRVVFGSVCLSLPGGVAFGSVRLSLRGVFMLSSGAFACSRPTCLSAALRCGGSSGFFLLPLARVCMVRLFSQVAVLSPFPSALLVRNMRAAWIINSFIMERKTYVRPETEVLEVYVGRGFAASLEGEVEGFDREEWNE